MEEIRNTERISKKDLISAIFFSIGGLALILFIVSFSIGGEVGIPFKKYGNILNGIGLICPILTILFLPKSRDLDAKQKANKREIIIISLVVLAIFCFFGYLRC